MKKPNRGLDLAALACALLGLALPACSIHTASGRQADSEMRIEAMRQNTLGVAFMNQQRTADALERFQQAYATDPSLTAARVNQAIALRGVQRYDEALQVLQELTETEPEHVRAWYNLGLTYRNLGETESAAAAFERARDLDPEDPDAHYLLGTMQAQLGRHPDAVMSYQRALELFPFHVSAEYNLARSYQALGQSEEARAHLERFTELDAGGLGVPMGEGYGEQGRYSAAEDASGLAGQVPDPIDVGFVSVAAEAGLEFVHAGSSGTASFLGGGACFLDHDGDGWSDVFLTTGPEATGVLYRNVDGRRFEAVWEARSRGVSGQGIGCAAADYDNDGMTDLAIGFEEGVALLRNDGAGGFQSTTALDGIGNQGLPLGLNFVDFDHDGDVDLYVARFAEVDWDAPRGDLRLPAGTRAPGNQLLRNNGDGTFTSLTAETALGGRAPGIGSVASDLNNDRAVDLIVSGAGPAPEIFLNPREGEFQAVDWAEAFPSPSSGVLVADFDKDGWMDLAFGHWAAPGLSLWRNLGGDVTGEGFERLTLPELGWDRGWGLAAIDYDNDGWLDLAALGETSGSGEIRVLRNLGSDGFEDATAALGLDGLDLDDPRALVSADYDRDGDRDLLATRSGGPLLLLRNDGGNRNSSLSLALEGLNDNKSAVGTKVEVFAGALRQKVEVQAASGYLGQSALDITAGLGASVEADTVRMLWPTGVLQDEVQLAAGQPHDLVEIDRRGSSCPVLFAWNGSEYGFVTDVIGAGVVGHWVGPGQRNVSDPTEYVKVPGSSVRLRDGLLSFRLAEPMEELVYLDEVRLVAVDHPTGVDVYPHEYFAPVPPFPEFDVITAANPRLPAGAWDDEGRDVMEALREKDRSYVTGFASTAFKGFAETHSLELDLGDIPTDGPVRLLLHGFVDYFSATSVYAAHQAGVEAIAPFVEALDGRGRWVRAIDDLGFPAGLARTMTRDITGRLPAGTRRIRITTNLKVYWDQILIDTSPEAVPIRMKAVPLEAARLSWLGYPRGREGATPGDVSYAYGEVSPTGPYARHAGYYTRLGDVRGLLSGTDDRFVIFGSGEQVALEFDPSGLPELETGWTRDYFFYADGFAKDMDFYEAHASTVGPLPFHTEEPYPYPSGAAFPGSPDHLEYQLEENTRPVSGRPGAAFRFDY